MRRGLTVPEFFFAKKTTRIFIFNRKARTASPLPTLPCPNISNRLIDRLQTENKNKNNNNSNGMCLKLLQECEQLKLMRSVNLD